MPVPVGILVGLAAGLFWGSVNGFLTTRLRIAPFIVTLGTLGIIRGLALIITNGLPVHASRKALRFWARATCWECLSCCGYWSLARWRRT